jgi:type IV pilus assembly protein PilA
MQKIELLVVIIILGILSAIALPSLLNQSNKARVADAETTVGSTVKGQRAFYLERNRFAVDAAELGLNLPTETESYIYTMTVQPLQALVIAAPTAPTLQGVAGKAYAQANANGTIVDGSIVCRGAAGQIPAIAAAGVTTCPTLATP